MFKPKSRGRRGGPTQREWVRRGGTQTWRGGHEIITGTPTGSALAHRQEKNYSRRFEVPETTKNQASLISPISSGILALVGIVFLFFAGAKRTPDQYEREWYQDDL